MPILQLWVHLGGYADKRVQNLTSTLNPLVLSWAYGSQEEDYS